MGVFLLVISMLMWSLVGTFVKSSLVMLDPMTITFFRFFFGVVFLGILLIIKDGKIRLRGNLTWIWLGAAGKCFNYFFENLGLQYGYSYGNILVTPAQTVFLLIMTVLMLKERVTRMNWAAAALCVSGVLLISWNGLPLHLLFQNSGFTTLLFAAAGIGAGLHVLSQKVLIQQMDAGNMNFSVFFWASLIMLLPMPYTFHWSGTLEGWAVLSLIALGLITGVSFYFFSIALKKVSFLAAVLVGNASPLFSILWGRLFFKDPITIYIIAGTAVFLVGILLLNLPARVVEKTQAQSGNIN